MTSCLREVTELQEVRKQVTSPELSTVGLPWRKSLLLGVHPNACLCSSGHGTRGESEIAVCPGSQNVTRSQGGKAKQVCHMQNTVVLMALREKSGYFRPSHFLKEECSPARKWRETTESLQGIAY